MKSISKKSVICLLSLLLAGSCMSGKVQTWAEEEAVHEEEADEGQMIEPVMVEIEDGEYSIEVSMTGGSGKAFVSSPTLMIIEDGKAYAHLTWSSSNYDYMIVGTEKYLNQSEEGVNSTFVIPISGFDEEMPVIADTLAMGAPREIKYRITFYGDSIGSKGQLPQEAAKRVVIVAFIIIIGGGILDHYVKKKRRC